MVLIFVLTFAVMAFFLFGLHKAFAYRLHKPSRDLDSPIQTGPATSRPHVLDDEGVLCCLGPIRIIPKLARRHHDVGPKAFKVPVVANLATSSVDLRADFDHGRMLFVLSGRWHCVAADERR